MTLQQTRTTTTVEALAPEGDASASMDGPPEEWAAR
jgi:hypothetical protein